MEATGWRPAIPLAAGIAQTVAWYRAHRDWWRELEPLVQEGLDGKDFLVDHVRPVGLPS
jgi:dTDP-D-glucose 4,6-dehydratase